jgi:hypothetical protein
MSITGPARTPVERPTWVDSGRFAGSPTSGRNGWLPVRQLLRAILRKETLRSIGVMSRSWRKAVIEYTRQPPSHALTETERRRWRRDRDICAGGGDESAGHANCVSYQRDHAVGVFSGRAVIPDAGVRATWAR